LRRGKMFLPKRSQWGKIASIGLFLWFYSGFISYAQTGVYSINRRDQWEKWDFPRDIVKVTEEGEISPVYIRKDINAALNAGEFKHWNAERDSSYGGIWDVGSNPAAAKNIIDGDPNTWWSPGPNDDLKDWWIEVDLGRCVAAKKIRLVFPDTIGAKPSEYFTVYVSDGAHIYTGSDLRIYKRVWRASKPNKSDTVEIKLTYGVTDTTLKGEKLTQSFDFDQVQYVKITIDAKSETPALAELEVYAIGDNIALRTLKRGGKIEPGTHEETAPCLFDGDMGKYWGFAFEVEWEKGAYFKWDLGALFMVDQIVVWTGEKDVARGRYNLGHMLGYILEGSDGSKTPDGKLKYQLLADVDNSCLPHWYNFNHIISPPRPVRYIFWRHAHCFSAEESQSGISEIQVFAKGYPLKVVLTSDFIDIGRGEPKNIEKLKWEADTPPGTEIKIRSRSGNTLIKEKHWYNINGEEIPESLWKKLPRLLRGPVIEEIKPGGDWSNWGRVYDFSGQAFLSPSPRRYIQLQVELTTKDPEKAAVLRSISIYYSDPLIKRVVGRIEPREAEVDSLEDFAYWIKPSYSLGDVGFDEVLIRLPSGASVEENSVELEIFGRVIRPVSFWSKGDSLIVQLPRMVLRDSVGVRFKGRLLKNGSVFEGFVGNSRKEGIWQRIDPEARGATTVLLPRLAESEKLIAHVRIRPNVITPNGDGISDEMEIRFTVLKVEKTAEVRIYNLGGKVIRELSPQPGNVYVWDGLDDKGNRVLPGAYVCRIFVDAESGDKTETRMVYVVY